MDRKPEEGDGREGKGDEEESGIQTKVDVQEAYCHTVDRYICI